MISARYIQKLLNSPSRFYTINECEEIKDILYILADIEIESISTLYFSKQIDSFNNLKTA